MGVRFGRFRKPAISVCSTRMKSSQIELFDWTGERTVLTMVPSTLYVNPVTVRKRSTHTTKPFINDALRPENRVDQNTRTRLGQYAMQIWIKLQLNFIVHRLNAVIKQYRRLDADEDSSPVMRTRQPRYVQTLELFDFVSFAWGASRQFCRQTTEKCTFQAKSDSLKTKSILPW